MPSSQQAIDALLQRLQCSRDMLDAWTERLREWFAHWVIGELLRLLAKSHKVRGTDNGWQRQKDAGERLLLQLHEARKATKLPAFARAAILSACKIATAHPKSSAAAVSGHAACRICLDAKMVQRSAQASQLCSWQAVFLLHLSLRLLRRHVHQGKNVSMQIHMPARTK